MRTFAALGTVAGPLHSCWLCLLFMLGTFIGASQPALVILLVAIGTGLVAFLTGLIAMITPWTSRWCVPWCWFTIGLAVVSLVIGGALVR